jgi:hypothetical protein
MATTYDQLVTNINNYVIQISQNFTVTLPTFIANAETRLNREINSQNLTKIVNLTSTSGSPLVAKPSDWMITRALSLFFGNAQRILLEKKTYPFMTDYWPNPNNVSDLPLYYMEVNSGQFYVAPTPNSSYNLELFYQFRQPSLSPTNQTNIFASTYDDLLLYASLSEAYKFIMDTERTTIWELYYQNRLQAVNAQGVREERDDMRVLNQFNSSNTVATGTIQSSAP